MMPTPGELFGLDGRHALVTGGGRGIGRAIAEALAAAGAAVAVAARTESEVEAAAAAILDTGGEAVAVVGDVATHDGCERMVADARMALHGEIDVLVHAAVVSPAYTRATKLDPQAFREIVDTNLASAFSLARAVRPGMAGLGGGAIVFVASVAGLAASPRLSAYGAAKGGLLSLTRTLAVEFAELGIRVNALVPGWVETDLSAGFSGELGDPMRARTPLGRFAAPAEMAGPALLLASGAGSFMTGSLLVVDGGYLAA
jgi:gluconate 5-dehydrogenase